MSDNNKLKDGQWMPYVGPQDGVGWSNGNEVIYDDEPPGEINSDAVEVFLDQVETDAQREEARQALGLDEENGEGGNTQTSTDTGADVGESVQDIVASVDRDNTDKMGFSRDPQMEFERLKTSEVRELKQTLSKKVTDVETVDKMWDLLTQTKVTAEGTSASYVEGLAEKTFDMEGEIIGEVGEDRDWYSDEEQQIMEVWSELSEKLLEDSFGEDYDLHRGVSEIGGAYFAKSFFADPESDDFEVEETLVANYTPSKQLAKTFSHGNLTITETEPDPICANDMIRGEYMQMGSQEGEVWLPGAEQSAAPENIVVGEVGGFFADDETVTLDEIQQPIEELDERGLEAIKPHAEALIKQARAGEVDVSEAVAKRLQTFFNRYDEINDGFLDMFSSPIDVDVDRITNMQKDEQEIDLTDDKGWLERGRMIDDETGTDSETAEVTVEKAETTMSKDDVVEIEAESVNPKWLHRDPPQNSMQDSDNNAEPMTRSYTHPDMVTVGTVRKVADKYLDGTGLSESDFVPNKDMYETAMDAIDFVDEYGMPRPENQQEGITRAHQIRRAYENDSPIEFDYWNEINNYHKRKHAQDAHVCDESSIAESDKESINQNEHDVCMFDPGWYSCQTWGGEAGYDQAERIVSAVEDADVEKQGEEIDIPGYPEIPPEDDIHPKMIELLQSLEDEVDWENSDKPLLYHILGSGTPPYKMSKEDANYDTEPHGNARCGNCEFYYEGVDGSGVCSQVKGNIMPSHWCRLWVEAELDVEDLPADNPESPDNKSLDISKGVGDAQLPDTYEDATVWALSGVVRGLDSIPFGKHERVVKRFEGQIESGKKLGVALSTVLQDELDWSERKANRETVNALTNDRVTKIDELNGE